jgi:GH24 family phage-related lysozyme (muramidase)
MAARATFAHAPESADAVPATRGTGPRPFSASSGARLRQAAGWAGATGVSPSRAPVRASRAEPGPRSSQRMLLRECDCVENPGTPSCEGCEQRQVQRSGDGLRPSRVPADSALDPGITSSIDASRGGGRPLERTARERLERGLGEPLGDVRVHADANAAALARAVSARAFTVGSDLFFAAGAYRPGSHDGDKLIAHEVTHAVQQRGAPGSGPLTVSASADAAEVEAEAMASTLQAEAGTRPHGESASPIGHEAAPTAGMMRVTPDAALSIARTTDFSDPYQAGYNDGQAGNPPAPLLEFSSDALDAYNQGYQDGQAQAGGAQAAPPPALAAPVSTASPPPGSAPAAAAQQEMLADDPYPNVEDGEQPQLLTVSDAGLDFIIAREGNPRQLYNDSVDACTIGVGHKVHDGKCNGSEPEKFKNGLTDDDVKELFSQDVGTFESVVSNAITSRVNQYQFDALVSFAFNIGPGGFQGSSALKKINQKKYSEVPAEMMKWVKPPELTGRRTKEATLFRTGQY